MPDPGATNLRGPTLDAERPPLRALATGTMIAGKYRIVSLLGHGGMGAVYRAQHVAMQREVALKVIRPELATDSAVVVRFEREALAASRISSPDVVTIHDFGCAEDGTLYLVMELLRGESLADRIERDGAIAWEAAARIAVPIARALSVAHAAGIVHRDLKPENIFLGEDGTVKVLDFGIARFIRSEDAPAGNALTQTGAILGTALYISPEAAARSPVGPPADLYALGAILFELLTGRVLFEEEHAVLLMGAHLRTPPERVLEARPELDVPLALDALVDRMLEKDPGRRPSSADAVARELERILVDPGERGPRADPSGRSAVTAVRARMIEPRAPQRGRRALYVMLAVASSGVALAIWLGSSTPPPAAPGVEREPAARPSSIAAAPAEPVDEAAEIAPAPEPASIEIRFDVTPAIASITHEGASLPEARVLVPSDGAEHVFVIAAPGYRSETRSVRADRDREISLELRRTPRLGARPVEDRDTLMTKF